MRRLPTALALACALYVASTEAAAETPLPPDAARAAHAPLTDFRFQFGSGAFWGETLDGVLLSLLATYRLGPIEAGATLEGGTQVFGGGYAMTGVTAGPVWRDASGLRFEMLGVLGQDHYSGIGCGMFCDGGGASARMPYGGARAGVSYAFGKRRSWHFELGAAAFYGSDFERRTVAYTTYSRPWLDFDGSNGPDVSTHQATLGGMRRGAMITLGFVADG
jgi:hypothetical protein